MCVWHKENPRLANSTNRAEARLAGRPLHGRPRNRGTQAQNNRRSHAGVKQKKKTNCFGLGKEKKSTMLHRCVICGRCVRAQGARPICVDTPKIERPKSASSVRGQTNPISLRSAAQFDSLPMRICFDVKEESNEKRRLICYGRL